MSRPLAFQQIPLGRTGTNETLHNRVARFFLTKYTKMEGNYTKRPYVKWLQYIQKGQRIYQPFPLQGPQKFTQIVIFGFKNTIWQPCFIRAFVKMPFSKGPKVFENVVPKLLYM
jgi:hypothetical protein